MGRLKHALASTGVLAVAAAGLAVVPAATAVAAAGGPVILGGDDMTAHGYYDETSGSNVEGWLYLEKAIDNVAPAVTRSGNDGSIAALGSADSTDAFGGDAGAAIHYAAAEAGTSVTYYNGATAINAFFTALAAGTADPAIIWIAGDDAWNDLSDSYADPETEAAALTSNAAALATFVNSGGGLISHGTEYGWLSALLPTTAVSSGGDTLALTSDGQAAFPGLTDADVSAGPWHNHFTGDLGGLKVLANGEYYDYNTDTTVSVPVIIGGAGVVLGSISLDPPTSTGLVDTEHTVTATVYSNGAPASGVSVSFSVTSGPNAGDTGTGTTDGLGQATFAWTGDGGTGTDTVSASFTDTGSVLRSTTATRTWTTSSVNAAPTSDAGGPYSGDEGSAISVDGTGADADSDPLTYAWSATPSSGTDPGASCSFAGPALADTTVTCTDDGTYTLTLAVSDGKVSTPVTDTATLVVSNVAPTASISSPTSMSLVTVGSPVTVTASYGDAGTNDSHTCTVDFGNGTGPVPGLVDTTAGTCTATATYTGVATPTVTVTVTDDDGDPGTADIALVVVDALSKVTGGGWVHDGVRSSFGFVAKAVEAGGWEGQLQVRRPGSRFHGTTVTSLSTSTSSATWTGTGRLDGVPGYGFTASVVDNRSGGGKKGAADTFSITVTAPGGAVVYTATGSLRGGNLTVHRGV